MTAVAPSRPSTVTTSSPVVHRHGVNRRGPWLAIVYWVTIAITLVPIVYMIVYSFNDAPTNRLSFAWNGFTTYWYANLVNVSGLGAAFVTSVVVAFLAAIISVAIGLPLALALERYRFRGRGAVNAVVFADIAAPSIVVGSASLSFFLSVGLGTGFLTVLITHVAFDVAYVVVVLRARISGTSRVLEEAASDLGATPFQAFRLVTLPLLAPGMLAAGLLALAMSIDDYVITSFVAGPAVTFPLFVYGAAKAGMPPQVLCFGTLVFAVGLLVALLNGALNRRLARTRG
ncbi:MULTISPECIES: ABC transporter permease [unclassified Curtobacterium]|uniref:ABC transporter permease n=1 Tax=unclassified Curtobacterium TaxID=257496 RepID=UPI000F464EAC|nr:MULTISPECIES: ABC transporter permease [unclassified Curtobacterium]ROQ16572.1 spermidine/putrescine transport system permease protein [Curtobacterium sp. PhB171]ROQ25352.1 spermidine/putrescine transport system permease protein [Curtobacterium sp. PhB170]ROS36804.1 spermidine/putrescine transport system permease protein [Curtobacterium sp. PhB131]ROS71480.1 spermidine/putrescine transport system permease protein [Curtobacterium sp. PhB141]